MPDALTVALSVDALGPRLTGIGRYCLQLTERLPVRMGASNISYFRGDHWLDDPQALLQDNWRPVRRAVWRRQYENWQRRRKLQGTIVHSPNYFLPEWAERSVATIHDLSVFLFPETHPAERVRAFEQGFERTLARATKLITDTETVRQELIAMFGVRPDRVLAVPLAASTAGLKPDLARLQGLDLRLDGYILCVSTFEPRKRIAELVRAYAALAPAIRARFPLVLAGASGWRNDALMTEIEAAATDGTVRLLGFVDEPTLGALYAGAALFVYPSRYEGFGLPVLEAMAQGAPCLIGDAACLSEVAKGAARIVQPDDLDAFANGLLEALEDASWRCAASTAGRAVADTYSWDKCISETIEVYRSAAR